MYDSFYMVLSLELLQMQAKIEMHYCFLVYKQQLHGYCTEPACPMWLS